VALSMGKEGYDDFRRYKLDQVENKKVVSIFCVSVHVVAGNVG